MDKVKENTGYTDLETIFGWEIAHRSDKGSGSQVVMLAQESSDGDRNSGIQRQVK